MPKPLRSANPQPRDIQFTHFGVLDTGTQSRSSVITSVVINGIIAFILIVLSAAAIHTVTTKPPVEAIIYPPLKPPPPPPRIKIVPPKPLPKPPLPKPVPTPVVVLPNVTPVVTPKPVPVAQPKPTPVVTPAPPKRNIAAAAPQPVRVVMPTSASAPNRDPNPKPISLGSITNPIQAQNRPAVSNVNLGHAGAANMPPGSGRGPNSAVVNLGSGQPNGRLGGTSSRPSVTGVTLGVRGGTPGTNGNGRGTQTVQQVKMGGTPQNAPGGGSVPPLQRASLKSSPKLLYKPPTVYTQEARDLGIQGLVAVKIRVASNGAVTVLGVTSGLGHGLNEKAIQTVQGMRFTPALDSNGRPMDWEGVVNISFQLAT